MWANCPWSWKLRYVDGHKFDDSSIHTIFGTAMHEVIQDWLHILYKKSAAYASSVYLCDSLRTKLLTLFKQNIKLDEQGEKIFLCDKPTLMEFYEQGCLILSYIQENHKKLFPTEDTKLFAIEYPLKLSIQQNVDFIGFIDIVTHNTVNDTYVLYDLKTSRSGWSSYQKKDFKKIDQLLLYKPFFAAQEGIDIDNISVEFVILKRFVSENADFHIPRVSKFEPSNGHPSVKKAMERFDKFVNTAFTEEGEYVSEQIATPDDSTCKWCVYRDKLELCSFAKPQAILSKASYLE
jgi:hypothetical protein